MNLNTVVLSITRRVREFGFVAGMALVLAIHLPSVTFAQDGIDRVTGFARDSSTSCPRNYYKCDLNAGGGVDPEHRGCCWNLR